MLKKYIFYAATKIQSLWRGHHARTVKVVIRRRLGNMRQVLLGAAIGWKIRRIFRTKEVRNRIRQIYELRREEMHAKAELHANEGTDSSLYKLAYGY
jgi:hypothetical protein